MAFGAGKNVWMFLIVGEVGCYSTIHALDSCLHFYSLCSQDKCGNVFFDLIDPDKSVWLRQKKQKSRHNADCTAYLYINMCMIDASFENSSCLFSLLNKLTTCYTFCITV